ncbi:hypothetical protein Dimus_001116, partial [Dionaea muscipula]
MMWMYESGKHRDLLVRDVVERTMREGLGSVDEDLRPDRSASSKVVDLSVDSVPFEQLWPDLRSSTEADAQPDHLLDDADGVGCNEVLGTVTASVVFSDIDGAVKMATALPASLPSDSILGGAQEKVNVGGEEPGLVCVADVLPFTCFSASDPVSSRCGSDYSASLGFENSADLRPVICSLAEGFSSDMEEVSTEHTRVVADGRGLGEAMGSVMAGSVSVATVNSCLHSLSISAVDTVADGFVREEVRVSLAAREALRPQPTDGLWQPPSSPVEPVAERVEKEKGIHGGASVAQAVHEGVQASRTYAHRVTAQAQTPPAAVSSQRVGTESAPDRSSPRMEDQGWQQSQSRRGRTLVGSGRGQQVEEVGRVGPGTSVGAHISSVGPDAPTRGGTSRFAPLSELDESDPVDAGLDVFRDDPIDIGTDLVPVAQQ